MKSYSALLITMASALIWTGQVSAAEYAPLHVVKKGKCNKFGDQFVLVNKHGKKSARGVLVETVKIDNVLQPDPPPKVTETTETLNPNGERKLQCSYYHIHAYTKRTSYKLKNNGQ